MRLIAVSAIAAALAVAAAMLSPPVERLADASQAVAMARHMLLAFVVAPLLVKGEAARGIVAAVPGAWRGAAAAWLALVGSMIFWHLPRPIAWASDHEWVQVGESLCFVGSGVWFWSVLLSVRGRRPLTEAVAVLYCASALAVTDLLGAVMTLSPRLLCRSDQGRTATLGLTALEDQQLAGLVMWIPGTLILLLFLAVLFPAWLRRRDQFRPAMPTPSAADGRAALRP